MKKLMTLMFLGLAAFAGGGLMNEQNLTTFVNYLYHKQQVGNVINLGTIADSPPAELPPTLPATPGAVPTASAPNANSAAVSAESLGSSTASPGLVSTPTAPISAESRQTPGTELLAKGTETVPGATPPPISIQWPDRTVSTFRASPNVPEPLNAAPPDQLPTPVTERHDIRSLPPSLPESPAIAAVTPHVPPPQIEAVPSPMPTPAKDDQVGKASSAGDSKENTASSGTSNPDALSMTAWKEIEVRMRTLGVVRYEVFGTPDGNKKFRCELAIAGAPKFEGNHEELVQAAQMALKRVVLFHGARKASGAANRNEDRPARIPASNLPNPYQEAAPGIPIPPNPAGPLTPPPDLPN